MIPVLRTYLPDADKLNKYNRLIDKYGNYSNFGKLNNLLSQRIAERFNQPEGSILLSSSGTTALQAALLHYSEAKTFTKRTDYPIMVGVPCWTFQATIQSIISVGMTPVLLDVDETGYLSPSKIMSTLDSGRKLDIIITVLPFGRSADSSEWDIFTDKTGIPVVIDAASCIFTYIPAKTVAVVSLHATKGISTGEGGFLISSDLDLIKKLRCRINFGFESSRVSTVVGFNGKLSEHACAVGLASLDDYDRIKNELYAKSTLYHNLIQELNIPIEILSSETSLSTTFNIRIVNSRCNIKDIILRMASVYGIEIRSWWGDAIIDQPIASYCLQSNTISTFSNSRRLAESVVGLPFGEHITNDTQAGIIQSFHECICS